MNRSPRLLSRTPLSPRAASLTSMPAAFSGVISPAGWNCTSSGSRNRAPASTGRGKESPGFSVGRGDGAEGVAGVLVATRGRTPPDARVPSGREDHRVGVHKIARAIDDVETVGTEHSPVVDQQPCHVHTRQDGDGELLRTVAERSLHLQAGVLAGDCGTAVHAVAE